MFYIADGRKDFYQWDLDRRLSCSDEEVIKVHYYYNKDTCLTVERKEDETGYYFNVPNILLQNAGSIRIYAYCLDYTKIEQQFKVIKRPKPDDYIYTETELYDIQKIVETIVEDALKDIEIGGMTEEEKAELEAKIANKLDKTTEGYKIYATGDKGHTRLIPWTFSAKGGAIPLYEGKNGGVLHTNEPSADTHCVNKKYFDDNVKPLEARVADLESLTLSYPEITSTDYEKVVPVEVGKYALLKMIGGASEKIEASKNLINPKTLDIFYLDKGEEESEKIPFTVDSDGWISFSVNPAVGGHVGGFKIAPPDMGEYECLIEGTDTVYVMWGEISEFTYLEAPAGWNFDTNDYDLTDYRIRVMLYKVESDYNASIIINEAPEGTVFEPYHEPYFINAEVERVESVGANLVHIPDISKGDPQDIKAIDVYFDKDIYVSAQKLATVSSSIWRIQFTYKDGTLKHIVDNSLKTGGFKFIATPENPIIKLEYRSTYITDGTYSGFMVNYGNSAAPYRPYRTDIVDSITIPVEAIKARVDGFGLDKNYIQWTDDKVEFVQRKKKVILNSTNNFKRYNTTSIFYFALGDNKIGYNTSNCTHFENTGNLVENGAWNGKEVGVYTDHPDNVYKYFSTDFASIDEFKAWLDKHEADGNPVILEYELAEHIVTDITDLFTEDNAIEVEGGGVLRFVNEHEMPVPNTVGFITRKGG